MVREVEIENVQIVRMQPPEAVLHGIPNSLGTQTGAQALHGAAGLGSQHHPVPLALQGLAQDSLAFAAGVDIGSVQEVYASVQSTVYNAEALRFIGLAAEGHGSQAHGRYLGFKGRKISI